MNPAHPANAAPQENPARGMKLVWATDNAGKLREIRAVLEGTLFEVVSYSDVIGWVNGRDNIAGAAECGSDYEENALIKAWSVFARIAGGTGESVNEAAEAADVTGVADVIVAADDSGIEIDYLNGWPGIFSSRFAGSKAGDEDRIYKILGLLKDVPLDKRKSRFRCSIGVYLPDSSYFTVSDSWEGFIALKPEGDSGFGYDPIFFDPVHNMTAAQMDSSLKNRISHRGKALRLMKAKLDEIKYGGR